MGKFNHDFQRMYWLQRALSAMPENPPKEKKFQDCTPEERASRYLNRAYTELTGETFDRQTFYNMMNPDIGKK